MSSTTARASRWRSASTPQPQRRDRLHGHLSQLPNNFNAPSAVCMAAVLYVFRTLVDDEIPLNAGCLKPLKVIIPPGSMLNPHYPASVVSGNVETSTCITNALYGALGVMAASQGTMNNFTFGNARYQYYETISGGSGAGEGFDGTDVVQTNMTNSRLTDPEILEFRFPVRLESYAIRAGSGGAGRWHGGNGGVRKVRFLEPMTAAILSNNRILRRSGWRAGSRGRRGGTWCCGRMGVSRSWGISARWICRRGMCLLSRRRVGAVTAPPSGNPEDPEIPYFRLAPKNSSSSACKRGCAGSSARICSSCSAHSPASG
jgi:N-methylhydantoinase B/oxoprolinase/acetone carboxylase alpha subunit